MSDEVPDAILERYRLGELPAEAMTALRIRSGSDVLLRERLAELERSDADILSALPPGRFAEAFEARHARRSGTGRADGRAERNSRPAIGRMKPGRAAWRPLFAAPAGLAAVCGLLFAVRTAQMPDAQPGFAETDVETGFGPASGTGSTFPDPEGIRLKGAEAGLAVFRKTAFGAELIPPYAVARPGDTVQVFYQSRVRLHGVIFSMDGAGSLTLHYPEQGDSAVPMQPGEAVGLPHAYRLDRAPRVERFYLITAESPFPLAGLLDRARASFALRKAAPDSLEGLDPGFRQYTYTLRKPGKGGARP